MIFQTLKHKTKIKFYFDGKLSNTLPDCVTHTWKYCFELKDKQIEYANLYIKSNSFDVLDNYSLDKYRLLKSKIQTHFKAIKEAKINTDKVFIYDLIPFSLLSEYCEEKEKIIQHIFDNYSKPTYYNILLSLSKIIEDIKQHTINGKSVVYDMFKSKTGRLTTEKGSFPVLTLKKENRINIFPENDVFLSLDYNAFEARVFLALSGQIQPDIDIHEWNSQNVFSGIERDLAKKDYFAWLYNPEAKNKDLEKVYKREFVLEKYYKNNIIHTPFGVDIFSDQYHALNYLIQSTASYLFFEQVAKIEQLLKGKKSFISFMIHDSLILDFDKREKSAIKDIVSNFEETRYGKFLTTVKIGKNFGEMRKINV